MLRRVLLCFAATGAAFGISAAVAPFSATASDICVRGEAEYPIPVTVAEQCVAYWDDVACTIVDGDKPPAYDFYVRVCWPQLTGELIPA